MILRFRPPALAWNQLHARGAGGVLGEPPTYPHPGSATNAPVEVPDGFTRLVSLAFTKEADKRWRFVMATGKFEVYTDKAGKYRFRLKAANGQIIAWGEGYESKAS